GTKPGQYYLVLRAKVSLEDPLFVSRTPITLVAPKEPSLQFPARTERMPSQEAERTRLGLIDGSGPVRIDVVPPEPVLVRGLPGEVFIRTTSRESGEPLACDVRLAEVKGLLERGSLPRKVRTNALGIARVTMAPTTTHHWVVESDCKPAGYTPPADTPKEDAPLVEEGDDARVLIGEVPALNRARLQIGTAPAQLSLKSQYPWLHPGHDATVGAHSLFRSGAVFVNLYREGHWIWSGSFGLRSHQGGGHVSMPSLPPPVEGAVYTVRGFSDLYV
ncbi:unnamed protein product, partial [Laminaria digitata]